MNCKYSKTTSILPVVGLFCLFGTLTACEDDLIENGPQSGPLVIKVAAPEEWTTDIAAEADDPDSRCISIDAATSESTTPLYVHTIESANVSSAAPRSRGAMKNTIENFSMSAICYTGDFPEDEFSPNFAYDLTCKVNSSTASCTEKLLWPTGGKVRFFAYAPVNADRTDDPFALSASTAKGSPRITYTVPADVKKQHDLMAACTDATSAEINLNFRHILTAVKVVTATDMIPGTITEVRLSGIPATGTFTPDPDATKDKWQIDETSTGSFKVQREVSIDGGYTSPNDDDKIVGDKNESVEVIGETGDFTMLMIPQTLPEGAKLEIDFKEKLSEQKFTMSASLAGTTWPEGKIITYSISPSSINVKPIVEFNKTPNDSLPYSGVWHDIELRAYAEVTKAGVTGTSYVELPTPELQYSLNGGSSYSAAKFYDPDGNDVQQTATAADGTAAPVSDLTTIGSLKGMYVLSAQADFTTLQNTLGNRNEFLRTSDSPADLYELSGNESANCYMLDQPGYYKFPVVYGNTYKDGGLNSDAITITHDPDKSVTGLEYYVDYNGAKITTYAITDAADAVLAWQDAPDLIDQIELITENGMSWVKFRVRKHSITQGNALIVVRDASKNIMWSWHIWVSQHTAEWRARTDYKEIESITKITKNSSTSKYEFTGKKHGLASVNLGYCDPHTGNAERQFKIKFKVKVNNSTIELTKYTAGNTVINAQEKLFTQKEFKGSLAGDNPYYQWGRSAPTPGGIYNSSTPTYYYKGDDYSELNMENKPTFNENYKLTRNTPGTSTTDLGDEKGASIKWAISHPHVFIMSKYDDKVSGITVDYRDRWFTETDPFQLWNPKAKKAASPDETNEELACKSVYDPCPAGYLVPQANVFTALTIHGSAYANCNLYRSGTTPAENYKTEITNPTAGATSWNYIWTVTITRGKTNTSFSFPATGVRNKSLRYADFSTVTSFSLTRSFSSDHFMAGRTEPAFRSLTFITSSTYITGNSNASIFYIDNRYTNGTQNKTSSCLTQISAKPGIGCHWTSATSYGMPVRPILDKDL